MSGSNLRAAPPYITAELVKRVLDVIATPVSMPAPVNPVPVPAAKPTLRLIEAEDTRVGATKRPTPKRLPALEVTPKGISALASSERLNPTGGRVEEKNEQLDRALMIAFNRGVALIDVARTFGQHEQTLMHRSKRRGLQFGKRPPFAETATIEELLALGEENSPLPELRKDRLKRDRLERSARTRREARALKSSNTQEASGTARKAPGATSSGVAKRGKASASSTEARHVPAAPARPAPNNSPARAVMPETVGERVRKRASVQFQKSRRTQQENARQRILAGEDPNKHSGRSGAPAFRAAASQLAEEQRLADPLETAKTSLRRAGRVVYAMSVHGGDANLFFVSGLGRDVTREQLFAEAKRNGR